MTRLTVNQECGRGDHYCHDDHCDKQGAVIGLLMFLLGLAVGVLR